MYTGLFIESRQGHVSEFTVYFQFVILGQLENVNILLCSRGVIVTWIAQIRKRSKKPSHVLSTHPKYGPPCTHLSFSNWHVMAHKCPEKILLNKWNSEYHMKRHYHKWYETDQITSITIYVTENCILLQEPYPNSRTRWSHTKDLSFFHPVRCWRQRDEYVKLKSEWGIFYNVWGDTK